MTFGDRLRAVGGRRGLSQEALALHVGLDRTSIGKLERGEVTPRLKTILRLARGLDVKPGELVEGLEGGRDE